MKSERLFYKSSFIFINFDPGVEQTISRGIEFKR